jgi:ectoine hydroxylase-related dioxygenase (phytanoyl-CoA dioxygenase family)
MILGAPSDTEADAFRREGFCVMEGVLDPAEVEALIAALPVDAAGRRNLLSDVDSVRLMAARGIASGLVARLAGHPLVPVRALFFDKPPGANWGVGWHQDVAVALSTRCETPGFGPWSVKAGVLHAHAPAALLEEMLTLRFHLDDCPANNGALRVIPGSHLAGRLAPEAVEAASGQPGHVCSVRRGGVVAIRPLLLHASSSAAHPEHRRVVHIEYGPRELPGGLRWHGWDPPGSEG